MMFKIGQVISKVKVKEYIKSLANIDEEILDMYTNIFDSYICCQLNISELDYSRINVNEEMELIKKYSNDIKCIPPIVTSPSFNGKRIVYDGCHRCYALELNNVQEVLALIPYKTTDGRMVKEIENSNPDVGYCKHGDCKQGKCCMICEHNKDCGGTCNYCFELGSLYHIVSQNISLFCDGVWQ